MIFLTIWSVGRLCRLNWKNVTFLNGKSVTRVKSVSRVVKWFSMSDPLAPRVDFGCLSLRGPSKIHKIILYVFCQDCQLYFSLKCILICTNVCISDVFCGFTKGQTPHDILCILPSNAFYRVLYPALYYVFHAMWIIFAITLVYGVFQFIFCKNYIKQRVSFLDSICS